MRSESEIAGHFLVMCVTKLSMRPFGKFSPHCLQVCGYRLLLSFSFGPRSKYSRISGFGLLPIEVDFRGEDTRRRSGVVVTRRLCSQDADFADIVAVYTLVRSRAWICIKASIGTCSARSCTTED